MRAKAECCMPGEHDFEEFPDGTLECWKCGLRLTSRKAYEAKRKRMEIQPWMLAMAGARECPSEK